MSHPMTKRQWVTHRSIFLPVSLINCVSPYDPQDVSDTTLFLGQAVSSIMSHPMNRMWVTLPLYFFTWQFHQSCLIPWPTGCEWHCFICSCINHVSLHPMINSMWVTLLYFFANQSHQSCLISWPKDVSATAFFLCQAVSSIMSHPMTKQGVSDTALLSLPVSLINHVSSHDDQQGVSETAWCLCQASQQSCLIPTNSMWVTLLYFFARQSHWSCLILWPAASEWCCLISLPGSLLNDVSSHDHWTVCKWHCFSLWQEVSSIMFYLMTNSLWVTLLNFFASLISYFSSHDQQFVSDTALCLCNAVSSIISSCDQWQGVSNTLTA